MLAFLLGLCSFFKTEFYRQVLKYLGARPAITGLTVGIEKGYLLPLKMYGQDEYVGWALNVACRLQGAVKDGAGSPAYKALVSNEVYNDYLAPAEGFKVQRVKRTLKNIRGNAEYHCRKIHLLPSAGRTKAKA